jgi:GTP pyrophosphokinase
MTIEQQDEIVRAARWSEEQHVGQKRRSGEPYVIHPIRVAEILAGLFMDHHTVQAGLLHDVLEDTDISKQELKNLFGPEVEMLVNGVTKINIVNAKNRNVQESETIRICLKINRNGLPGNAWIFMHPLPVNLEYIPLSPNWKI